MPDARRATTPVKPRLSGTPPPAADDQTVDIRDSKPALGTEDPEVQPAGQQAAPEQDASDSSRVPPPAERLVAERTERRHQRMLARESSSATHEPDGAERRKRSTGSSGALTAPGRQTLRDAFSVSVIGVLVTGAALGALLGALSVAGWLIGLLVGGLTVILSRVLRPGSRST